MSLASSVKYARFIEIHEFCEFHKFCSPCSGTGCAISHQTMTKNMLRISCFAHSLFFLLLLVIVLLLLLFLFPMLSY